MSAEGIVKQNLKRHFMKQFFINLFGWLSQGDIVNYPNGELLVSHTVSPDKDYTFNQVFVGNIKENLWK